MAGDQRRALAGVAKRLECGVLLGHVDDHAEDAPPLGRRGVGIGAHHHPADAVVAAQDPELDLLPAGGLNHVGADLPADALPVVGMDALRQPLGQAGHSGWREAVEDGEGLRVPVGLRRLDRRRPQADAGGMRRRLEPARQLLGLLPLLDPLGHVEGDADEGDGVAGLVALDHAARHHVAVGAVGAPVARLHVGGLVGDERLLGGGEHQRDVVRMDERANLVDREALGPRLLLQHPEGAVVVVHALGAKVVPPDRDLPEVDGELELGVDVDKRPRRLVGLGVVHHDPDGAVGGALRPVLHRPLGVDQAGLAVGLDDAIALRIAASAPGRIGIDHRHPVVGMDALDRLLERRRAGRRVEAPEAEHVPVPAPFAGRNAPLPDADAAEFLGDVEQLALAVRLGGEEAGRADVGEGPEQALGRAPGAHVGPEQRVVGGAQPQAGRLQQAGGQSGAELLARRVARRAAGSAVEQARPTRRRTRPWPR